MSRWTVTLTDDDLRFAREVGVLRQRLAQEHRRHHAYGLSCEGESSTAVNVEGCYGELAAAKALDVWWTGVLKFGPLVPGPDISDDLQVRCTKYPTGRLIVHPGDRDKDGDRFILVIGEPPTFELVGWCYGREGKRREWLDDPTGSERWAYFVPQRALRDMADLELPGRKWP